MRIRHHLYDVSMLIYKLKELAVPSVSSYREVLEESLKAGAHPYFLEQTVRVTSLFIDALRSVRLNEALKQSLKDNRETGTEELRPPSVTGIMGPLSRVYSSDWIPYSVPEGILHGVFAETYWIICGEYLQNRKLETWRKNWEKVLPTLLAHPAATIALADNINSLITYQEQSDWEGVDPKIGDFPMEFTEKLILKLLKEYGIEMVVREAVGTWCETRIHFYWLLWIQITVILQTDKPVQTRCPFSQFMMAVFALANSKSHLRFGAAQVLNLAEHRKVASITLAGAIIIDGLKAELPDPFAYHTIARWLQLASEDGRELVLWNLVARFSDSTGTEVDMRTEFLLENLLGKEAWMALCEMLGEQYWKDVENMQGFHSRRGIDKTSVLYRKFLHGFRNSHLERHDSGLAQNLDMLIHSASQDELSEAEGVWDQAVNLLAGDTLLTVTHLRTEWMAVRRKDDEYMSGLFPNIETAQHPVLGDNGAACIFRLNFPEMSDQPLTGRLDAEGEMTLDQIRVLTPAGSNVLRAVVAQSLAAILIPRYLDKLPPRGQRGFRLLSGEIWASRPVVHRLGEIREEEQQGVSGGSRIHPVIAEWLFEWLLDIEIDQPYRLYRIQEEKVAGHTERFFQTWREAKGELQARRVSLSAVYHRTVRAFTRPAAVRQAENGTLVVQQMSARAKRKYNRYRQDVGRELDFSPVRKTYVLPGGMRMVLDIPRTFNQGSFNTLQEVWEMIPDPTLKDRARSVFVF